MLDAHIYNCVIHAHLLKGNSFEFYKEWSKIFFGFACFSLCSVWASNSCVITSTAYYKCVVPEHSYPHFNTALHWMMDTPLLPRSFVFAPQWYGNSTLLQRDSFLPPPVSLLKAHSHAIQPLRDSLEHWATFVSLVLSFRAYFAVHTVQHFTLSVKYSIL